MVLSSELIETAVRTTTTGWSAFFSGTATYIIRCCKVLL